MRPGVSLTTFALVFPAELPDKTTLATLVLASRYRARPVWAGAAVAFLASCLVAVTAAGFVARLPDRVVSGVAAALFAAGAVLALRASDGEAGDVGETAATRSAWRIAAIACGTLFVAELGDFTQLTTAALAVRYQAPAEVLAGAWLALVCVSGLACVAGRRVLRVVPFRVVRLVAAALFAAVAVRSVLDVLRDPPA